MSGLGDLVVELVNKIKESSNVKEKIFFLEQIKEILFHRDKSIMNDMIPNVFELMLDRSVQIRIMLIKIAGECARKDNKLIPRLLILFSFVVVDGADAVLDNIANEFTPLYDKIAIYISNIGVKQSSNSFRTEGLVGDAKEIWNHFRSLIAALLEMVSSNRSDQLRLQSMKLRESMILFGLCQISKDPRILRQGNSITEISLHHPFINRSDLESEAEAELSKLVLWATRGGPHGYPFSPALMGQLGYSIGKIACARPTCAKIVIPAVIFIVSGKLNLIHLMNDNTKEMLAKAIENLISLGISETDDSISLKSKLKEAHKVIESSRSAILALESTATKRKASHDALEDDSSFLDLPEDWNNVNEANLHHQSQSQSARLAIDDYEKKSKFMRSEGSTTTAVSVSVPPADGAEESIDQSQKYIGQQGGNSMNAALSVLILASDLGVFTAHSSSSVRLAHVTSDRDLDQDLISTSEANHIVSLPPPPEVYTNLTLGTLNRLLASCFPSEYHTFSTDMVAIQLCLRMTLALSLTDITEYEVLSANLCSSSAKHISNSIRRVAVFSSECLPPGCVDASTRVPDEVLMPRSLWLAISYCLHVQDTGKSTKAYKEDYDSQKFDRLDLLLLLLQEMYIRSRSVAIVDFDIDSSNRINDSLTLYESVCLVVMSRIIQIRELRVHVSRFLSRVPKIPLVCMQLLGLLILAGTKPSTPKFYLGSKKLRSSTHDRGTKFVALDLMGNVIHKHECMREPELFYAGLYPVLSETIAADFSMRNLSVNILIEIVTSSNEELNFVRGTIILFALDSMISIIGMQSFAELLNLIPNCTSKETMLPISTLWSVATDLDGETSFAYSDSICSALSNTIFKRDRNQNLEDLPRDEIEAFVKRQLHLVLQLCTVRCYLLRPLFDLYATSQMLIRNKGVSFLATSEQKRDQSINYHHIHENLGEILCSVISLEICNIIPVISKFHAPEIIFASVFNAHPACVPLVEAVLQVMCKDLHMPATTSMVQSVCSFVENLPQNDKNIRLIIPVIGGMKKEEVESLLPKLIASLHIGTPSVTKEDTAMLGQAISRMTQTRPPPLPRASLLVALHRINGDKVRIKNKAIIETINCCLSRKEEFRMDVVKDALTILLDDPVPPFALMFTARIASIFFPDIQKYFLGCVIPKLITGEAWKSAPVVWDGVGHYLKSYSSHREVDNAIHAIITLPQKQLEDLLMIAPSVRDACSRYVKSLPPNEYDDIVTLNTTANEMINYWRVRKE